MATVKEEVRRYTLIQHNGRSDLFRRSGELLQTWHTGARLRLFN